MGGNSSLIQPLPSRSASFRAHHGLFTQPHRCYTTGKEDGDHDQLAAQELESSHPESDVKLQEQGQTIQDRIDELKLEIGSGDKAASAAAPTPSDMAATSDHNHESETWNNPEQHDPQLDSFQTTSETAPQPKVDSQKSSDEVFEEMLDKYYTNVDNEPDTADVKPQDTEGNQKRNSPIQYYSDKSSTYYRESKIKLQDEIKNFKSRVAESITDYKSHYSDWRSNDAVQRQKEAAEEEANKKFKNHTFNKYENYLSGYETTMEMPKKQVAKAFALPVFIAAVCGYFINRNGKKPKNNECWCGDEDGNDQGGGAEVIPGSDYW